MQVNCSLCGAQNFDSNMFACYNNGSKTYECTNEKQCRLDRNKYREEQRQVRIKKFTDDYNICLDDLEKMPRFRDGCIHFYDRKNDRFFIKSIIDGVDVMPKLNLNDQIIRRYISN